MVGRKTLDLTIMVRIHVSQLNSLKIDYHYNICYYSFMKMTIKLEVRRHTRLNGGVLFVV
jgi:hypothetical protein